MIGTSEIGIVKVNQYVYPSVESMFRPSERYPEYIYDDYSNEKNEVYDAVREALKIIGFDKERSGKSDWNPFKDYIKPGMSVLLKPNLVMDRNKSGEGVECLYTHPAVVAPIIDYVIKALEGRGKIIVGDAPVQECNFEKLIVDSGYKQLISYYRNKGIDIELIDFREAVSIEKDGIYCLKEYPSNRSKVINLGKDSEFYELDEKIKERLRITNYNPDKVKCHHIGDKNEYKISSYVLEADVIINIPKPKTHRIAGMTAALKNFVGINARKEYLPHHTIGDFKTGGDESNINGLIVNCRSKCLDKKNRYQEEKKYFKAKLWLNGVRIFSKLMNSQSQYREGCWYGNNTICKTITDINKIVYYADKYGAIQEKQQRKVIIIADMIVSGQKNGPLNPTSKDVGIIAVGTNPVCFDETIAKLMGFDACKITSIMNARQTAGKRYCLVADEQIPILYSNKDIYNNKKLDEIYKNDVFHFEPTDGWKGHIEIDDNK